MPANLCSYVESGLNADTHKGELERTPVLVLNEIAQQLGACFPVLIVRLVGDSGALDDQPLGFSGGMNEGYWSVKSDTAILRAHFQSRKSSHL